MGVSTPPQGPTTDLARWLRPLGWASLVANVAIMVTGGAVRLTGSGLGCPTWPRCTEGSFVPHGELSAHQVIEFGNRTLTFVLTAVAVATFLVAWQSGRRDLRRVALVLLLGIPAQAVIGGITVLTGLNPWIVSLHLLVSAALVGVAVHYLRLLHQPAAGERPASDRVRGPLAPLAWATFVAGWVVLFLGTVVTGSGPHAGDVDVDRNGLDPESLSQLHADAVFVLVGLSVALLLVLHVAGATAEARRAVRALVAVEVAQAAIGFVQYLTDLPIVLVGLHVLGAGLVSAALTWVLLALVSPAPGRDRRPAAAAPLAG